MLAVAAPATAQVPAGGSTEGAPPSPPATSAPPPAGPTPPGEAPAPPVVPPTITVPSTATPVFVPPSEPGAPPPTATFALHPSVTAAEEYTDNFRLSGATKQENYRTTVTPGLALDINGAFTAGRIAYALTGAYDSSVNNTSLFHALLGLVGWQATPQWKLTVSDALTRSDAPESADRLSLRRQRVPYTSNTFSALSDYRIGRVATTESYRLATFSDQNGADTTSHVLGATIGTSFYEATSANAHYEYLLSNTSAPQGGSVSGRSTTGGSTMGHSVSISVARQLSAHTSAGATAGYSVRTSSGAVALSGTFGDYSVWNVAVFDGYTSGPLSLSGSLGFSRLTRDPRSTGSSRPLDAISSQTTLSYRFAQAVATLGFDSGFSETFAEGQNFGVVQTRGVTATLSYSFTPALSSQVTGFYRQNETTGVISGRSGLRGDSWGTTFTMGLRVTDQISLGLDYRHSEAAGAGQVTLGQVSGTTAFAENRVRLSLSAAF